MADSLADILSKKQLDEPPEIRIIKDFVKRQFNSDCSVIIQSQQITIEVPGAALASSLRMDLPKLKQVCTTDKRFVIRIA